MYAIISDIHANIEAFDVVLADIEAKGITEILCLGDLIGYGPNPREAIAMAKGARFSLLGNHEEAVLFHAEDFNAKARRAIDWTREQLNGGEDKEANYALWDFLGDLKKEVIEGDMLYVHGSPRDPTREYVLPNAINEPERMKAIWEADEFNHVGFCGHTHIPGVFSQDGAVFNYARQLDNEFVIKRGEKVLINVGSVGQPRDTDNRSCYVTVEGDLVRWHRLEYDFQKTMDKIRGIDHLADYLADRLRDGR